MPACRQTGLNCFVTDLCRRFINSQINNLSIKQFDIDEEVLNLNTTSSNLTPIFLLGVLWS